MVCVASQPEIQFSPISRDLMIRVWKFSYVTIVNRGTIKKWIKVLLDKIYVRDNYHRIQQLTLKLQIQNFDNQIISDKKAKKQTRFLKNGQKIVKIWIHSFGIRWWIWWTRYNSHNFSARFFLATSTSLTLTSNPKTYGHINCIKYKIVPSFAMS